MGSGSRTAGKYAAFLGLAPLNTVGKCSCGTGFAISSCMNTDRPTDKDELVVILPIDGFRTAFNLDAIQADNKRTQKVWEQFVQEGELE